MSSNKTRYPAAYPTEYHSEPRPCAKINPAMPRNDAADRYSPEIAAAFNGGETSRAPTTTVSSTTTAIAPTEAKSVIVVGPVDPVGEGYEALLEAACLVVVEDP